MPLYPSKTPFTVEADSVSPVENLLIRTLFPQTGDEPDIPMNPIAGMTKAAFLKQMRRSLMEQTVTQRVKNAITSKEANELYTEGMKSLEKLKALPEGVFHQVYSVPGSTKRFLRHIDESKRNAWGKFKWLKESGADKSSVSGALEDYDAITDAQSFVPQGGLKGYWLSPETTAALTDNRGTRGRGLIGMTNNTEQVAGETAGHELAHAMSMRSNLSEALNTITTNEHLASAKKATGVDTGDTEELFAEIFSHQATGNKYMLDKLSQQGLKEHVDAVGDFYKYLISGTKKKAK
jgi:hypothetical protein